MAICAASNEFLPHMSIARCPRFQSHYDFSRVRLISPEPGGWVASPRACNPSPEPGQPTHAAPLEFSRRPAATALIGGIPQEVSCPGALWPAHTVFVVLSAGASGVRDSARRVRAGHRAECQSAYRKARRGVLPLFPAAQTDDGPCITRAAVLRRRFPLARGRTRIYMRAGKVFTVSGRYSYLRIPR